MEPESPMIDEPSPSQVRRWAAMEVLARRVVAACQPSDTIYRMFHPIINPREIPNSGGVAEVPAISVLSAAEAAFYDLPEQEQRRILNGWRPCPNRPSLAELRYSPDGVFRVLHVDPCIACQIFVDIESDMGPMAVFPEGCSKEEALAALAAIKERIERDWARMIDRL